MPEILIQLLEEQYGKENVLKIVQGYQAKRKTTFRVNTLKSSVEKITKLLEENNITYQKVKWSNEAFMVENVSEKEIRNLDIYKKGEIYLQSLSSMLPPIILQPKEGIDLLDMAAAPGGKTTQIAAITNNKANITACERNKIRAERLKYNIEKQGAKVYLMIQDAREIDDFFSFDQILLDAPCSGSGTIHLEENKKEDITVTQIQKASKTQLALLKKATNLLKAGKEMVYSTCSILASENESILQEVLKDKKIEILPITLEGMEEIPLLPTKIKGTLCVCPNEYFEGFFIAKLRKIANK